MTQLNNEQLGKCSKDDPATYSKAAKATCDSVLMTTTMLRSKIASAFVLMSAENLYSSGE